MRRIPFGIIVAILALITSCGGDNGSPDPFSDTAGWQLLYTQPTGNTLNDVHMTSPRTAVAVGYSGTIIRTINGGATWDVLRADNRLPALTKVSINGSFGVAIGDGGPIMVTKNGGRTWQEVAPFQPAVGLLNVEVVNETTAFIACRDGVVACTKDHCDTWTLHDTAHGFLRDISFFNDDVGMIMGDGGVILWTDDGGDLFEERNLPTPPAGMTIYPRSIAMTSEVRAIVVLSEMDESHRSTGVVYMTDDGGVSWSRNPTEIRTGTWDLEMTSASTGYLCGGHLLIKTTDGGLSWEEQPFIPIQSRGFAVVGSSTIFAVGWVGNLVGSKDGGASWTIMNETLDGNRDPWGLFTTWFMNADEGFVCSAGSGIFKTTNGGETWSRQYDDEAIYDIVFLDDLTGLAVCPTCDTGMLRTVDGGDSWTDVPGAEDLNAIHFADALVGLGTGRNGVTRRTTNGGLTWTAPVTSPASYELRNPYCVNADTVLVIGQDQTLFRSTNGGVTSWESISTDGEFSDIDFNEDRSIGLAVGRNNRGGAGVYRTTDAGATWEDRSPGGPLLRAVHFADASTAYAVGQGGYILKTSDGGLTWEPQPNQNGNGLRDVFFTSADDGWAVGYEGTVLRTTTGGED